MVDQPLFILGSCDFCAEECDQLLRPLRSRQAPEIHVKKLRRSGRGQNRVIELFQSNLVTPERFKAQVFHKRFMLLTKLVDELAIYAFTLRCAINVVWRLATISITTATAPLASQRQAVSEDKLVDRAI